MFPRHVFAFVMMTCIFSLISPHNWMRHKLRKMNRKINEIDTNVKFIKDEIGKKERNMYMFYDHMIKIIILFYFQIMVKRSQVSLSLILHVFHAAVYVKTKF